MLDHDNVVPDLQEETMNKDGCKWKWLNHGLVTGEICMSCL